jgi:hypothetical protein
MRTLRLVMSAAAMAGAMGAGLLAGPAGHAQSTLDNGKAAVKDDYSRAKDALSGSSIQLSQVPGPAMAAAKREIGPNITGAKTEKENGQLIYLLEGKDAANKDRQVKVSPDGDILRSR